MMRINQLKAGVILSYATQAVQILSGLVYTPVMLRLLGQSEYGLYQLVASVVAYLSLLSLGFSSGYIRFYSRYKAENNDTDIAHLNGIFMLIFVVISVICLICGGVMIYNAELIFGSGLTESELEKARILMMMLVFSTAISFINSVYGSYITAHERFFFQRIIGFLQVLFNPIITLPLLLMGYGSVGMVLVSVLLTVVFFVVNVIYCVGKLKMKFIFRGLKFKLLKEMWVFTFFIFLNMIIDQINWSVDKYLLGRMIGTTAVAVYGVAGQLNSMYLNFSTSISSVFVPRVNKLVAEESGDGELTKLFTRVGRIQYLILALIVTGFILFGKQFIEIWAGEGYETSYWVGLFLLIPVTIPLIQNLGIEIQRAKNKHKVRSVVYFGIAIANVFVSIPFIWVWGEVGAAIGTALSLIIGNGIFMNIYYHKGIGVDMIYFWKEILKFIPGTVCVVLMGVLMKHFIPHGGLVITMAEIVIYAALYILIMWLMGMNDSEKDLIKNPLYRIRGKICRK